MSWHIYMDTSIFDSDAYGWDEDGYEYDEYDNSDFEYECERDDALIASLEKDGY